MPEKTLPGLVCFFFLVMYLKCWGKKNVAKHVDFLRGFMSHPCCQITGSRDGHVPSYLDILAKDQWGHSYHLPHTQTHTHRHLEKSCLIKGGELFKPISPQDTNTSSTLRPDSSSFSQSSSCTTSYTFVLWHKQFRYQHRFSSTRRTARRSAMAITCDHILRFVSPTDLDVISASQKAQGESRQPGLRFSTGKILAADWFLPKFRQQWHYDPSTFNWPSLFRCSPTPSFTLSPASSFFFLPALSHLLVYTLLFSSPLFLQFAPPANPPDPHSRGLDYHIGTSITSPR